MKSGDPIVYAIPLFVLLIIAEMIWASRRKASQRKDRYQRHAKLDGDADHLLPAASISISERTGDRSYPAPAAQAASSSGLSPRAASASDHSRVERVPERQ